jgi:hypothetical protein
MRHAPPDGEQSSIRNTPSESLHVDERNGHDYFSLHFILNEAVGISPGRSWQDECGLTMGQETWPTQQTPLAPHVIDLQILRLWNSLDLRVACMV